VAGADWLVSKVTVILLIVGHRPVFQPGPGGELLCPPQTAPHHLSGFTRHDDGVYFCNAVRLVRLAIAFRASLVYAGRPEVNVRRKHESQIAITLVSIII
jgi:hypothetical protein